MSRPALHLVSSRETTGAVPTSPVQAAESWDTSRPVRDSAAAFYVPVSLVAFGVGYFAIHFALAVQAGRYFGGGS